MSNFFNFSKKKRGGSEIFPETPSKDQKLVAENFLKPEELTKEEKPPVLEENIKPEESIEIEKNQLRIKWQEEKIRSLLPESNFPSITRVRNLLHQWNEFDNCNHFLNDEQIRKAIEQARPKFIKDTWRM